MMMLRRPHLHLAALWFTSCAHVAFADTTTLPSQPAPPDKSGYSIFHPTPREQIRELSTDRPDQTETPYTVDAGHIQVELDFANALFDRDGDATGNVETTEWGLAPFNVKVGLLNNLDLQIIYDTWIDSRIEVSGSSDGTSGTGDLQTRVKLNLWGNDGGRTAFAIMPFVKWPVADTGLGNEFVEAGVILPLGVGLSERCGLGVMTEFDFVRDENDQATTEFVNSATVGYGFTSQLGAYAEIFTVIPSEDATGWRCQADFGMTVATGENVRFDLGCNFGLTDRAPDYNPFVGLSFRL